LVGAGRSVIDEYSASRVEWAATATGRAEEHDLRIRTQAVARSNRRDEAALRAAGHLSSARTPRHHGDLRRGRLSHRRDGLASAGIAPPR
jgi:hypothetical protein